MENKPINKKDNSKITLIAIILILLGVIGYLVFSNQQKEEENIAQAQKMESDSLEISKKIKDLEELQLAYERMKADKEALGLETDSLDKQIQKLNDYIAAVKKGNAKEIKDLKNKINEIQADLIKKENELQTLIRTNDTLRAKAENLYKENQAMGDSISNLSAVKSELSEKVAIASVLKAENIKVSVLNSKGKELEKDEFKAKTIDKLKVSFNLGENKVARRNQKDIYLRVVEPNGAVLFTGDKFFTAEGKEIPYTDKKSINFDNTKQPVIFLYMKGSPYKTGKYTIELFAETSKIGETNFVVK
jgi:hypothetical protein